MCDLEHQHSHHHGPEFILDTPQMREFIAHVKASIAAGQSPQDALNKIRPEFAKLLADEQWLPEQYCADAPESGMGGGIGQWALYRAQDGSLTLFSLVVPPAASTPVHDHLAWGMVGLYRGLQDEDVYLHDHAELQLKRANKIATGDFYDLIPPDDDIHRITTTSEVTSVSLHLLTNDTGCIWRHKYNLETGAEESFKSGYVNVECDDDHAHVPVH